MKVGKAMLTLLCRIMKLPLNVLRVVSFLKQVSVIEIKTKTATWVISIRFTSILRYKFMLQLICELNLTSKTKRKTACKYCSNYYSTISTEQIKMQNFSKLLKIQQLCVSLLIIMK